MAGPVARRNKKEELPVIAIADICNTLADVNSLLAKAGFDVHSYPSSNLPPGFF